MFVAWRCTARLYEIVPTSNLGREGKRWQMPALTSRILSTKTGVVPRSRISPSQAACDCIYHVFLDMDKASRLLQHRMYPPAGRSRPRSNTSVQGVIRDHLQHSHEYSSGRQQPRVPMRPTKLQTMGLVVLRSCWTTTNASDGEDHRGMEEHAS